MILWHIGTTMVVLWFVFRGNTRLDYRLIAIGSLLPDIIDKPIGRILFADRFETGHLWGHTLLLNVLFLSAFFLMRGRKKRTLVVVPIASLLHLAEDGIWGNARVFWWPLLGWSFPLEPVPGGAAFWNPLRDPSIIALEVVGAILIVWLLAAHRMLSGEGIRSFVRTGHLEKETERL